MNKFIDYLQIFFAQTGLSGIAFFINFAVLFFFLGVLVCRTSFAKEIKKIRKDSVNRSRAVLGGQMVEQIAPFLPDFPCNPADCRFIGKPVDIIAFSGAGENNRIDEIVFIEVKTGDSQLSTREKEIRECIRRGKVRYEVYRWSASS